MFQKQTRRAHLLCWVFSSPQFFIFQNLSGVILNLASLGEGVEGGRGIPHSISYDFTRPWRGGNTIVLILQVRKWKLRDVK